LFWIRRSIFDDLSAVWQRQNQFLLKVKQQLSGSRRWIPYKHQQRPSVALTCSNTPGCQRRSFGGSELKDQKGGSHLIQAISKITNIGEE
jgi:hypothetical protein